MALTFDYTNPLGFQLPNAVAYYDGGCQSFRDRTAILTFLVYRSADDRTADVRSHVDQIDVRVTGDDFLKLYGEFGEAMYTTAYQLAVTLPVFAGAVSDLPLSAAAPALAVTR